jgi:hypothetical protein
VLLSMRTKDGTKEIGTSHEPPMLAVP